VIGGRNKKSWRYVVGIITLILILVFFRINFLESAVHVVAKPIMKGGQMIASPFSGFTSYFKSKKSLDEKNRELEEKIEEQSIRMLSLDLLENENEELRTLLGFSDTDSNNKTAAVISRPPRSPYDTLVIDLGKDDVSIAQKVYTKGILIGDIVQVHSSTAVVQLLSTSGNKFPIKIGGDVETEAQGQGGGRFVSVLPKDVEVEVGDTISQPGQSRSFALVSRIETSDVDSFQGIFFNFPFNLSEIEFVEIR